MSLVLPAPVNAHEQEHLPVGGAPAAEEVDDANLPESERLKKTLIYPPPEIRTLIDRTASALHRSANPASLEAKIREGQKADPKFSFLNSSDPYSTYYRYAQARLREGIVDASAPVAGGAEADLTGEAARRAAVDDRPKEPRALDFVLERPGMPPIDLDVLKLTALFTARRGRSFLASLSQREGRNFQFDFLRPTHSLYPLFQRLVGQYERVLAPAQEALAALESGKRKREGRASALEQARERSEWEKWRKERNKKRADELEAREIAFAQIDWQDFVLVETIDFTSADETLSLPAPTSVEELESRTLAQKREAAQLEKEPEPLGATYAPEPEPEPAVIEKTEAELAQERAREMQRKYAESQGTMKIRKDYVPKSKQSKPGVVMVMHNGEEMPIDEVANRIRIEQLDPKWKENKERLDARRTQAALLQQGADVSASLRELANARTDMFGNDLDEDARKLQEDAERARRKEKERVIWDGHTASKETTLNKFAQQSNLDEQIAAIHKKAGVATVENTAGPIGPGPAAFPKPAPPQAEQGPTGTISALPQPPSSLPPIPTAAMGSYSSLPAPPSAPSAALPPSIHPSRMAAMQLPDLALGGATGGAPYSMPPYGAPPPPPPGMPMMGMQGAGFAPPPPPSQQQQQQQPVGGTRPREEDGQDGPDAKRARTDGQPVSEAEWLAHNPYPITLSIQLPTVAGKPELDGSVISLSQVGLNLTVGVLRERIQEATKTTLPLSKMRLDTAAGKVLNNKSTLASINLATGDTLTLNIRK